jgi:hypothetical protein
VTIEVAAKAVRVNPRVIRKYIERGESLKLNPKVKARGAPGLSLWTTCMLCALCARRRQRKGKVRVLTAGA